MAENPTPAQLTARAAMLQQLLKSIQEVDGVAGDHTLTSAEFADAFVRQTIAANRARNPNDPDPLKQLRADVEEAMRGGPNAAAARERIIDDLPDTVVNPTEIKTRLRNNVADGEAERLQAATRAKAAQVAQAQARTDTAEQRATEREMLNALPPGLLKANPALAAQIRAMVAGQSASTPTNEPEPDPKLMKVIGELRTQLDGYKQENVGAPPSLSDLNEAIARASNGSVRSGRTNG